MGRAIVKINDMYLEWSTVADAPVTWGMPLDELKKYIKDEYGEQGTSHLNKRLERVETHGASWNNGMTLEETIVGNRAGEDEDELTLNELYDAYCLRKPIRNGWTAR